MAVQTTPHTNSRQDVDSTADLEPGMSRKDAGRGDDAKLYENSDGAQTGGTRAFNANAGRDHLPKSEDPDEESGNSKLPSGSGNGITNAGTGEERERQEKVVGK